MNNAALGLHGEKIAERYLVQNGYKIITRRWRALGAEIDLIARDGGEIVFVEVKTRHPGGFGEPEEALTPWKCRALRRAASAYIGAIKGREPGFRIDVISVIMPAGAGEPIIRQIQNAVEDDETV